MSINVSTRFKELILGPNSFASIFDGGRILLYSGTQPANADAAVLVPPIAEITNGGAVWAPGGGAAGLQYDMIGQWITKDPAQTWKMHGVLAGTATWFRIYAATEDLGSVSYSHARIDGSVNDNPSADFIIPSTTVALDSWLDVQQFLFTLLPLPGA